MKALSLEVMQERVHARKKAMDCKVCKGRGRTIKPVKYLDEANGYSQDCPTCGSAYKTPMKWSLITDDQLIDLLPLLISIDKKLKILTEFVEVGLISDKRMVKLEKLLKKVRIAC